MTRIASLLLGLAIMIAPAHAQNSDAEDAMVNAFKAEHQAWRADIDRWTAEHDEALRILREALTRFEKEPSLDRHGARISEHSQTLDETALPELAGHHARVRSQHEEMREAHHHLMDAMAMVAKAIDEDLKAID